MSMFVRNLYEKINGRIAIVATIGFLVFTGTVLPWVSALSTDLIGVAESIDTNFNFDINNIYDIVNRYGVEGRRIYIIIRWTFDIVWPLVYTGFLVSITAYFAKRAKCRFQEKILYVAILSMSFDFLENILATIVMAIYPTQLDILVYILILSSILKWTILGIAFVVPMVLLAKFFLDKMLSK